MTEKDRSNSIGNKMTTSAFREHRVDENSQDIFEDARYKPMRGDMSKMTSTPPRQDRFTNIRSSTNEKDILEVLKPSKINSNISTASTLEGRGKRSVTSYGFEAIAEVSETKINLKAESQAIDDDCQLTADEEKNYGKRFIQGYDRIRLLGKGGQALVWLAKRKVDGEYFAVKQMIIGGFVNEKTARKEIDFNEILFDGAAETDNLIAIGKRSIIRILEYSFTPKDLFMVLELCGAPLSKLVYSMKGEFLKSERIYKVSVV